MVYLLHRLLFKKALLPLLPWIIQKLIDNRFSVFWDHRMLVTGNTIQIARELNTRWLQRLSPGTGCSWWYCRVVDPACRTWPFACPYCRSDNCARRSAASLPPRGSACNCIWDSRSYGTGDREMESVEWGHQGNIPQLTIGYFGASRDSVCNTGRSACPFAIALPLGRLSRTRPPVRHLWALPTGCFDWPPLHRGFHPHLRLRPLRLVQLFPVLIHNHRWAICPQTLPGSHYPHTRLANIRRCFPGNRGY